MRAPRALVGAEGRLVASEDPGIADRRPRRGQRPAKRLERRAAVSRADPRPLGERLRCGGTEHVQVPACELQSSVARIDLWCGHGPDGRRARTVPPDHDSAGGSGIAEPVRMNVELVPRFSVGTPRAAEECAQLARDVLRPPRAAAPSGSLPSEKTARSRAATTYVLYLGPQSWTSDGSSQVEGSVPSTRAWIERSAARGMLSCRPAHAARRSERRPRGSRSSSAPTRRRKARICARVSASRRVVRPSLPIRPLMVRKVDQ